MLVEMEISIIHLNLKMDLKLEAYRSVRNFKEK